MPRPAVVTAPAAPPAVGLPPRTSGPGDQPATGKPPPAIQRTSTNNTPAPSQQAGPPPASGPQSTTPAAAHREREQAVDTDELARRLLGPLSRMLRADLRQGRERAGRLYDGRR
ncbi:hypothetical protein [Streptomyces sp. NPDC051218]|uniref:hypothetical protein n=1 Tax=Streptomyces sp. NPDC051218 TaxID=3365645 RepID=UPI00378E6E75